MVPPPSFMVRVNAEMKGEDWLCEVNVDHAGQRTRHAVTVKRADLERWGDGIVRGDVEGLVTRSFNFLLEHEPPNAFPTDCSSATTGPAVGSGLVIERAGD